MKKLHISDTKLPVPVEILNQHTAVLGKTRSGKSSVMRGLVENLLDREQPVCIVDPKGDWWGIKLAADGKGPGYPVVIFGGDHADVPINEHAGAHVAELFATGNRPCLIDLGGWTVGARTRLWIDFASTLFKHTKGNRYLVVDEIHNFAPKGQLLRQEKGDGGGMPLALHWTNRLASEGLGKGVIMLFASQRPQKVHNDTLTSAETLIAMRVLHPSDRGAVSDWIKGCGDAEGSEVLNTLAQMERGEGWVWSPEIGFGPQRVKFPMFATYDSFRPQTVDDTKRLKGWAEVDLEDVRQKMATYIEKAKADNPAELKRIIAQLQKELRAKPVAPSIPVVKEGKVDPEKLKARAQQIADRAVAKALRPIRDALRRSEKLINDSHLALAAAGEFILKQIDATQEIEKAGAQVDVIESVARVTLAAPVRKTAENIPRSIPNRNHQPAKEITQNSDEFRISSTQQRILDALAWLESIGHDFPSNTQLGAIALIDTTGGHFSNTIGPLSSAGLVERGEGRTRLTDAGRQYARVPEAAPSLGEYHNVLRSRVLKMKSASKRTIDALDFIIAYRGEPVTTEEIGSGIGIDHTGGHFSNTIGPLSTVGLITRREGVVQPTSILFPEGLQ